MFAIRYAFAFIAIILIFTACNSGSGGDSTSSGSKTSLADSCLSSGSDLSSKTAEQYCWAEQLYNWTLKSRTDLAGLISLTSTINLEDLSAEEFTQSDKDLLDSVGNLQSSMVDNLKNAGYSFDKYISLGEQILQLGTETTRNANNDQSVYFLGFVNDLFNAVDDYSDCADEAPRTGIVADLCADPNMVDMYGDGFCDSYITAKECTSDLATDVADIDVYSAVLTPVGSLMSGKSYGEVTVNSIIKDTAGDVLTEEEVGNVIGEEAEEIVVAISQGSETNGSSLYVGKSTSKISDTRIYKYIKEGVYTFFSHIKDATIRQATVAQINADEATIVQTEVIVDYDIASGGATTTAGCQQVITDDDQEVDSFDDIEVGDESGCSEPEGETTGGIGSVDWGDGEGGEGGIEVFSNVIK